MKVKRRIHVAWHILAASMGILLGAALALLPKTRNFAAPVWLIIAMLLLMIVVQKRARWLLVVALLGGVLLGLFRGSGEQLQLARYESYFNQNITMEGKVAEDVTIGSGGKQHIRLHNVKINRQSLHGQVWLSSSTRQLIKRGDILVVTGHLTEGFGTLAAAMYRGQIADVQPSGDVGVRMRDWFATRVRSAVPEPEASLGISYTLGQSQGLSETISDQFRLLGLTHLLVASGSQLTLLVRFARRPLSRTSKYLALIGSLTLIGAFLLLTGLSPSMVRAALVSVLSLTAWYYGRNIHPVVLLVFVAAITVLMQPSFIWGDVGWLLSFAAFGGIVILAPLIHHYFWGVEKEAGFLRYLAISTVSAQIVTLPLVVYTFGEYSPLAVVANLLVLPVVSIVMLLTLVSGMVAALIPSLGMIIGWPVHTLLSYVIAMTDRLAALPWAHGELKLSLSTLLASYMAIVALTILLWRQTKHNFRLTHEVI